MNTDSTELIRGDMDSVYLNRRLDMACGDDWKYQGSHVSGVRHMEQKELYSHPFNCIF